MASIMPIMMFIFNVVTLVIVYYGSKQIDLGNLAIGQMMAFMQYAMQIIMAFLMIAMIAIMFLELVLLLIVFMKSLKLSQRFKIQQIQLL